MSETDDDSKPKDSKKGKSTSVKQPLRTLPMRQAKINTVIQHETVPEEKISSEASRFLRPAKPLTTTRSTTKEASPKKATKATSVGKEAQKKVDCSTSTNPPEDIQPIIRRPSIRTARRNIQVKNIKARSSKCQLFFCDKCDKVYDHYSELVYHQRRHTGEKPFACTWPGCTAAFSASNARVRHLRIHTGEKPYVCPYTECGRRFTYWKDLKLHKFRHSGEKPHKCEWPGCSSKFFRRDDLKHHTYTHTGEKPYKCTVPGCESAFTQKSPLNLHMRKIHKIVSGNKAPDKTQGQSVNQTSDQNIQIPNQASSQIPSYNNIITNNSVSTAEISHSNVNNNHININNNINDNVPNICEYPVYQSGPTIIRQPIINNVHQIANSNNIGNTMEFNNHSDPNIQCMNVTDKLSSILVTCDVSPATVHGVNHQPFSNHDVNNSWSGYSYVQETVDLNQSIQTVSNTTIDTTNQALMKETSVQMKPIQDNINHIPNLNVLLSEPCQSNQVGMSTNNLPTNNNDLNSNGPINHIENIEMVDTQVNTSTIDSNTSTQTTSDSEKEHNSIVGTVDQSTIEKNIDKSMGNLEKANVEDESTSVNEPTPSKQTRKRANYRMKAPSTTKTGEVAIIRPKPIVESKSKTKATTRSKQVGAKRTIAIQTSKRQSLDKAKKDKFKCNYCEREFKAKHDRDCHHMTHTGEKPRACDWPGCDYRCITKSKLTRHQRKHTGERNYPCDWPGCGKKFSTSRHMKEHRRIHTGEKPFKCDWPGCDKWFSRKDHIKNHRFTHTGEKPRKCPFVGCEAAFIQLSPLKKHMELHKRDGGAVPNRTRKRKTNLNQVIVNEEPKKPANECNNNSTVQINSMTLEMVASRMISQNDPISQSYNLNILTGQENQNLCLPAYDNDHTNTQANIEYEVMFRHPTYC